MSQLLTELKEEDQEFEKNRRISKGKKLPSIHRPVEGSQLNVSTISKASDEGLPQLPSVKGHDDSFELRTIHAQRASYDGTPPPMQLPRESLITGKSESQNPDDIFIEN